MTTGTVRFMLLVILLLTPTAATGERTALHEAAERSQADEVKRLLKYGANVAARDEHGWTALHYVARGDGNVAVVTALLAHGADAAARTTAGQTPRDVATRHAIICLLTQTPSP